MLEPRYYQSADGELAALLASFYEAAAAPVTWSQAVRSVMESSRATVGLIVSHDYETGRGRIEHAENITDELVTAYAENSAPANVWLRQESLFRSADAVVAGEEVVTADELVATPFYKNWLVPAGIHHSVWGVLARKDKRLICAGFGRPNSAVAFERNDIALISQVMPHFRRIMQLRELVGTSNVSQRILMEMLGALSVGVALLDKDFRVMEANAMAAGWLANEHDIVLNGKDPGVTHNGLRTNLQSLLKSANAHSTATSSGSSEAGIFSADAPINGAAALGARKMSVIRADGAEPVTLILVPLRNAVDVFDQGQSGSILVISDPEYRCRIREDQLVKFYDFTPTEAKLARLLSNGYRLDQAASSMGIRYQTARTHLKRVFSKTGIDRQSELVRLILTGPASFRLPDSAAEGWLRAQHADLRHERSRTPEEPFDR
ncbi:helix-turn-helix transcriptional regulator [Pelagibius sp. Alg239-R121]|uniref:helix-turn-helix transcriptional regulator n=1 Tax=Pelagibius sp. Alg239-R121 TaxID=2993448 RepID=UPI0024A7292A|nr:helix-turn-helix transcriptional regulator [Pelagibius sp. Alg239-R121]